MSERVTERMMLDLLRQRYSQDSGNGERWIRAEHVRNGTGFMGWDEISGKCRGPLRTADFVAIDGWESKGHVIHGHEVKVSRGDWLTELRDPEKANAFLPYCHYWWAVTTPDVVRGDLPFGWGLMVRRESGLLRVKVQAPYREATPLPWPMTVGLTRAVQKTAQRERTREVSS